MVKRTMLLGAVALFGAAAFASETKLLEELVAIPSVSRDIPQVNRAQRHMQAWLEATDARCFHDCGVPVALIGLKGGGEHAVDEWVSASGIDELAGLLVEFLGAN